MSRRLVRWLSSPHSTRFLGYVTLGLVVFTLLMLGRFGPTLLTNSETLKRSDDLAACRAEARAAVDTAEIALATATASVQSSIAQAVTAAVMNDDPELLSAANDLQSSQGDVSQAIAELKTAAENYGESVVLSREEPDDFLEACR